MLAAVVSKLFCSDGSAYAGMVELINGVRLPAEPPFEGKTHEVRFELPPAMLSRVFASAGRGPQLPCGALGTVTGAPITPIPHAVPPHRAAPSCRKGWTC